jgi:hypothetical protein
VGRASPRHFGLSHVARGPGVSSGRCASAVPVPDHLALTKLIWSTMAAVDQANRTSNYSVLHGLGSPAFQANNSPPGLAAVFTRIRLQRIDLSDTFLVEPVLDFPARIEGGIAAHPRRFPDAADGRAVRPALPVGRHLETPRGRDRSGGDEPLSLSRSFESRMSSRACASSAAPSTSKFS